MTINVDLNRRPLYLQLRDVFAGLITSGEWKPHAALPNEVQLAVRFGVSVGTIRKVMDELSDLGLVTRLQGKGTFVSQQPRSGEDSAFDPLRNLDGTRIRWDPPRISVAEDRASQKEAARLGHPGRKIDVVRLRWLRANKGRVAAYQQSTIPVQFAGEPAALRHVSGLSELYARAGVIVHSSEDTMGCAAPDRDIALSLNLGPGQEVQHLSRRFRDGNDEIVGLCESWFTLKEEVYTCTYKLRWR